MFIIAVNDLDLSMGAFVSFVACVTATYLNDTPFLGLAILAASIAVYAALGVVIYLRQLPAIVVTLGMSFVWTGIAVMILPAPGGAAPEWIRAIMTVKPPLLPMAIVASALIALVAHLIVARSSLGVLIRGVGGNERSVARAGWSVVRARAAAYALGGFFAVLAGMALVGRVNAVGAVVGALTLTLAGSFLSFLRLSPDWQIGAQGAILILVLALRLGLDAMERRRRMR
jgi:ribose transport system permease protein